MKKITLLICVAFIGIFAFSQESNNLNKEEYLLNGTSFTFQYQNSGAVEISFAKDMLTYKWLNGRNVAEPAKTLTYKSKKVDAGIYLVNWHEPDSKNYITMVYNFNSNSCAVSVISKYNTEKPFLGFQSGVIEHVTKN